MVLQRILKSVMDEEALTIIPTVVVGVIARRPENCQLAAAPAAHPVQEVTVKAPIFTAPKKVVEAFTVLTCNTEEVAAFRIKKAKAVFTGV